MKRSDRGNVILLPLASIAFSHSQGQKQTLEQALGMSALPPKADVLTKELLDLYSATDARSGGVFRYGQR